MTQTSGSRGRTLGRDRVRLRLEPLQRELLDGFVDEDEPARAADVCVVPWFSDERPFQGLLGLLDWRRDGSLSALVRGGFATGRRGECVLLPAGEGMPAGRLVLLGCGERASFDADVAASLGAQAARAAIGLRPGSVVVGMPTGCSERDVLESLFAGLLRGIEDAADDEPEALLTTPSHPWWVAVEERHLARLRRVLDGPLRAAVETTSSS